MLGVVAPTVRNMTQGNLYADGLEMLWHPSSASNVITGSNQCGQLLRAALGFMGRFRPTRDSAPRGRPRGRGQAYSCQR